MSDGEGFPRWACITLDLEDTGGLLGDESLLARVQETLDSHGVRLTAFVVGKLLEQRTRAVEFFRDHQAEFELHSYTHELNPEAPADEIRRAKHAYERYFGCPPRGYRAPWFGISTPTIGVLEREGFLYDSSSVSSIRPGVFSRVSAPNSPFRIEHSALLELPVSVLPLFRLAYGLSYMKLSGLRLYRMIDRLLGWPVPLVFYFHLHDLQFVETLHRTRSWAGRRLHSRNIHAAFSILDAFLETLDHREYRYAFMSELYDKGRDVVERRRLHAPI